MTTDDDTNKASGDQRNVQHAQGIIGQVPAVAPRRPWPALRLRAIGKMAPRKSKACYSHIVWTSAETCARTPARTPEGTPAVRDRWLDNPSADG
jgi:hypothetical protein